MRVLLMLLAAVPAFSQFLDLATDRTGSILLLRTMFRQQTEADVTTEQKIYQYRDRAWTRLTVFEPGGGIIPGSLSDPFVAGDGSVYGWNVFQIGRAHV